MNFNILDVLILIILISFSFWGYQRGIFKSLSGFLSFFIASFIAFLTYSFLAKFLNRIFQISLNSAEILSVFLLFFISVTILFFIFNFLANRIFSRKIEIIVKILGIPCGLLEGFIFISIILILLSVLPFQWPVGNYLKNSQISSFIKPRAINFYNRSQKEINSRLPSIIIYPEYSFNHREAYLQGISEKEWAELDGATCFACGGQVEFKGFKKHIVNGQEVYSPYFVCPVCGRHSDGCQTYEGYHKLYGECPERLGELGYRFDCGMWPNGNFVKPYGHCPVCHPSEIKIEFQLPLFYSQIRPINLKI